DMIEQQTSLMAILDSTLALNLNTVFLQIRPQSDAFYESSLVPWSEYLTGSRGTDPGYDPLQFAIEEAHKRGLELHGWLNPYRYETSPGKNDGKPGDLMETHPEWLLNFYDHDACDGDPQSPDLDDRILNPGLPEVRHHIKEVVGEIINNYDIDGIHFDDYFYPYCGTTDEDAATFSDHPNGFTDIEDWRRNNVHLMVEEVMDTINQVRPHIRFGLSPSGIYGDGQPPGIVGFDAYNIIYVDPIQWLSSGNVDYLCPQIYRLIGGSQDFGTILPWWADSAYKYNRHVMAGHGIYKLDPNPTARITGRLHEYKDYLELNISEARLNDWSSLSEISNQIHIVRENRDKNAMGSAFFRYRFFYSVNGLAEHIVTYCYNNPAILPAMTWKSSTIPDPPTNVRWEVDGDGMSYATWNIEDPFNRYIIYSSSTNSPPVGFFDDPVNILKIAYDNIEYLDEADIAGKPYIFVSTYDRFANESTSASLLVEAAPTESVTLLTPNNLAVDQPYNFDFSWTPVTGASNYKVEISSANDFQIVDFDTLVVSTTINARAFELQEDHQYFWRVTPVNSGGEGPISETFTFDTRTPLQVREVQLNEKLLSVSYNNYNEIIIKVKSGVWQQYRLSVYDLYGNMLALPMRQSIQQDNVVYIIDRTHLPYIGIIILELDNTIEFSKVIGKN
ncbi:MAG: family 10 glycosylhydrolase, partial [Bacteroidota bacterium]